MILFVCSLGKLRSRTAELLCLFGGLDARCCGTAPGAYYPANDTLLRSASLVVCMEAEHKRALKTFAHYDSGNVVTLGIPDVHGRLAPELVAALIYQVGFHSPEVALAMEKGYACLSANPAVLSALVSQSGADPGLR